MITNGEQSERIITIEEIEANIRNSVSVIQKERDSLNTWIAKYNETVQTVDEGITHFQTGLKTLYRL
jgi:septal ring factor EnvC (AmiA/AmiB activator)